MTETQENQFIGLFEVLSREIQYNSAQHGFWDAGQQRNQPEMLALMHSELSEALEAIRSNYPKDKHCPTWGNLEIELADCIIRIMDFACGFNLNVAGAILVKHKFNKSRPHKHGRTL